MGSNSRMGTRSFRLIGLVSLLTLVTAALTVVLGFEQAPGRLLLLSGLGVVALPVVVLSRGAMRPQGHRMRVIRRALISRRAPHALSLYVRLLAGRA
jgi:hypothetical protein